MARFEDSPDDAPADLPAGEAGPAGEADWERASLDGEGVPPLARHFRITDRQHWLDLCA
jgi:hypothetical protein